RSRGGCPGSTTSRATWSLSRIGMPRAPKNFAAVDLPLAMPPVSPTRKGRVLTQWTSRMRCEQTKVASHQRPSKHEHEPAGDGEEGAEGNRKCTVVLPDRYHGDAHHRTRGGGDQDHRHLYLNAAPPTE